MIHPFRTAARVNQMSAFYIVLKRDMTSVDYIDGEKDLKQEAKK